MRYMLLLAGDESVVNTANEGDGGMSPEYAEFVKERPSAAYSRAASGCARRPMPRRYACVTARFWRRTVPLPRPRSSWPATSWSIARTWTRRSRWRP